MIDDIPQAQRAAYERLLAYLDGHEGIDTALVAARALEPVEPEPGDDADGTDVALLGIDEEALSGPQRARLAVLLQALHETT
jgi:hypothetical protein